jgi:DNA-binding NtrC family response regulator
MNTSVQVLVVSRDPILLETRQLILKRHFRVKGAANVQDAERLVLRNDFELIILCYTLNESECARLLGLVQSLNPIPRTLALSAGGTSCVPEGVEQLWIADGGPGRLVARSAELLGIDLNAKIRTACA